MGSERTLDEEAEAMQGLLRVYGDVMNSPTENELFFGCKDGARMIERLRAELQEAVRLLRELTIADPNWWKRIDAFLAKHPKPAEGSQEQLPGTDQLPSPPRTEQEGDRSTNRSEPQEGTSGASGG